MQQENTPTKKCRRCEKEKPFAEFRPHPKTADGLVSVCKLCTKVQEEKNQKTGRRTEQEFEDWWRAYPRKVGKGAALMAYRTARREATPEALLSGVERYSRSVAGKDPEYIAHPTTWLRQKRWLDEPPVRIPVNKTVVVDDTRVPELERRIRELEAVVRANCDQLKRLADHTYRIAQKQQRQTVQRQEPQGFFRRILGH